MRHRVAKHDKGHGHAPAASRGLFDGVRVVHYNEGGEENGGKGNVVEAYVLHATDEKNLVLGRFVSGNFQQINGGNPVPQRSEADYGPEGGGVTWDN